MGCGTSPGTENKQAAKNSGNANKEYHRLSLFCRSLEEVNVARRYASRIRRRNKMGQRMKAPQVSPVVVRCLSPSPGDTRDILSHTSRTVLLGLNSLRASFSLYTRVVAWMERQAVISR